MADAMTSVMNAARLVQALVGSSWHSWTVVELAEELPDLSVGQIRSLLQSLAEVGWAEAAGQDGRTDRWVVGRKLVDLSIVHRLNLFHHLQELAVEAQRLEDLNKEH